MLSRNRPIIHLPFIICGNDEDTWESGPYTLPGKAVEFSLKVGELAPLLPLLIAAMGELFRAMLKSSPWWPGQGRAGWLTDPGLESGL